MIPDILKRQRLLAKINKLKIYFQRHNITERHPRYERMRRLLDRYKESIIKTKDLPEDYDILEAIFSDKVQKDYLRLTEKEKLKKKKKKTSCEADENKWFIKKKVNNDDDDVNDDDKDDSDNNNDDDVNDDKKKNGDSEKKEKLSGKKEKIVINPVLKGRVN